jgi:pimeloyl-ACP methyl ester carboxylesterase
MSDFKYKGSLFYKFYYAKSSQTLVFIHGFSLDHRMWQPQIEHFSSNYNVLVYDLRGFGKSTIPNQIYSHHDDLFRLIKHLELQQVHLVGLSMGGRVAIDFTLEHPTLVRTLTVLDSSLGGYRSTVDFSIRVDGDMQKAREQWLSHEVFKYTNRNNEISNKLKNILTDYSGWHWLNDKKYEIAVDNAKDRLNEITCPTKILVGEYDLEYFKNIGQYMHKRIENSEYRLVPDSGHMSNLENAEFVNDVITQMIKS